MLDERNAIAVLSAVCRAELDRHRAGAPVGATFEDHPQLLQRIARELESLADVLNIQLEVTPRPVPCDLLGSYRRVLELPLARTVRVVLTAQLGRLERVSLQERQLDAA